MVIKWRMMLTPEGKPMRRVIMIESKHLRKLLIIGMFIQISVLVNMIHSSGESQDRIEAEAKQGQRRLAKAEAEVNQLQNGSNRAACERGKTLRTEIADIIDAIGAALRDTDNRRATPLTKLRINSEETIEDGLARLRKQATLDCYKAFPEDPKQPPEISTAKGQSPP